MRVGGLLPVRIRPVPGIVLGPHRFAQLAVANAEAGRARACVIGREQHLPGGVHGYVAGARSGRVARGKLAATPRPTYESSPPRRWVCPRMYRVPRRSRQSCANARRRARRRSEPSPQRRQPSTSPSPDPIRKTEFHRAHANPRARAHAGFARAARRRAECRARQRRRVWRRLWQEIHGEFGSHGGNHFRRLRPRCARRKNAGASGLNA